jgi:hypothetical protein
MEVGGTTECRLLLIFTPKCVCVMKTPNWTTPISDPANGLYDRKASDYLFI